MKRNKRNIVLISGLLILCILAAVYVVKLANQKIGQAESAETKEAVAGESSSEISTETKTEPEPEGSKKIESICAYRSNADDTLYSMESYDKAIDAGAGTIVMPFVVSQDDTMYVADDDYALDMTGYGGYFSGMSDAQIAELVNKDGSSVLKVQDVFDKYGEDIHYVIELKYTSVRNLEALRRIIEKYGLGDNVSVSCQYFNGLRSLESYLPEVQKIFICSDESEFNEALYISQVDAISVSRDMMSEELCEKAHEQDKKFSVWTLDTKEDIQKAIGMGADSIFTDEAGLAVASRSMQQ